MTLPPVEFVFYAKPHNAEDWQEEIIGVETTPPTTAQLDAIRAHCERHGMTFVRVARIDLTQAPSFGANLLRKLR